MYCPFCFRTPKEIPGYVEESIKHELSPHEYIRIDVPTYHIHTDLFCCDDCYRELGYPTYIDLINKYNGFRSKVTRLRR